MCPHDGTPAPGTEPVQDTQTVLPLANPAPSPDFAPPTATSPLPSPQTPGPAAERDELMGQRLGEYVVRERIGSGGMGVVYAGEHTAIGRKVAIKFIREDHARDPNARDLLTEARAAGAIRHHGVIDIHGFGHQPGVGQYLVMEYLEGRPLNELVRERAPLPPSEALPILCEVLDALSAAHAMGVIHRDLKPSNIFVVRQSNGSDYIKVLDFGLAKRATAPDGTTPQTHSNLIVGTPQYMSPEQALCEAVGPQTDLYAVGVIAFELLTGQRPFPGRSHMEVVAHHLRTPAPAPSSLVPQSPELDDLVLRLLAKEPQQRPASASEVARELRALLQSPESSGPRTPRTLSRPLPAVKPAEAAPLNAPTATLSPAPSSPTPSSPAPAPASLSAPPPARGSRWKWGAVAGGTLVLALGVGVVMRGSTEPLPTKDAPPPPVTAAPTPAPSTDSMPASAPMPRPTPAPAPVESQKPAATALPPAKKKTPKPVQQPVQPVTTAAREPPPTTPEPTPAPSAPERAATGTLHLMVKGAWAEVWIDGQKLGRIPPQNRYPLAAGEHALELRNPNFPAYRQTVVVPANGTLPHTVDFAATAPVSASPSP
ncbi:serine/threonine-protein kinase [Archangium sp.]|uniref:serine/threonine-protein kinase n=1 Tax=Archangium sp. TaxID=1872627 RepID=UPI00389AE8CD